jgi:hypothetical protein
MAYNKDFMGVVGTYISGIQSPASPVLNSDYYYLSSSDDLATISATNYFSQDSSVPITQSARIRVYGSDGTKDYLISIDGSGNISLVSDLTAVTPAYFPT